MRWFHNISAKLDNNIDASVEVEDDRIIIYFEDNPGIFIKKLDIEDKQEVQGVVIRSVEIPNRTVVYRRRFPSLVSKGSLLDLHLGLCQNPFYKL